jgi:phosphoribosylanthranilate isomerase
MVRVKICGITNRRDALMAVDLGANALGFVFAPSPRQISPEAVRVVAEALPPFVQTVGVFVNEDLPVIRKIMDFCGLNLIQLHGNESPEFCRELMPQTIKAFRLKNGSSLVPIRRYTGQVKAIVLDAYQKGIKGGTGRVFDWNLGVRAGELGIPIILSGGLTPSNIQSAISAVKPYAVDVSSGIEERPGKKSPLLMKQLIEKIRGTND